MGDLKPKDPGQVDRVKGREGTASHPIVSADGTMLPMWTPVLAKAGEFYLSPRTGEVMEVVAVHELLEGPRIGVDVEVVRGAHGTTAAAIYPSDPFMLMEED